MKISDIVKPLQCEAIHKGDRFDEIEIRHVIASDLMSDVLVVDLGDLLLVTSLPSDQSIRTADIVGAVAVLVVNGKTLPDNMKALAREMDMALLRSPLPKFEACIELGRLMNLP